MNEYYAIIDIGIENMATFLYTESNKTNEDRDNNNETVTWNFGEPPTIVPNKAMRSQSRIKYKHGALEKDKNTIPEFDK